MASSRNAVKEDNLHDDGGSTDDNYSRRERVDECNVDDIQTDALRELARDWADDGRRLEAGKQLCQLDFVFDLDTGVSVYEAEKSFVADDGRDRSVRLREPRDAAQLAIGYVDEIERERFPEAINEFFDGLDGFTVRRGGTDEDTPAIQAEGEDIKITVSLTTDDQWWLVSEADGRRPLSEMYEQADRVVEAAREWLDAVED